LEGLLEGFCPEPRPEDQVAVSASGCLLLLRLADIDWLEAEDGQVMLHVGRETHRLNKTLAAVMAKLPPERFVGITPFVAVNLRQIKGLRRLCQGEWQVLLRDGTRLAPQFVLGEAALVMAKCWRAAPDQIPSS
jgi:two-component system LytT family response regulator